MTKNSTARVHVIDETRGLAILLMVVYHFFFDLVVVFHVPFALFTSSAVHYLEIFFSALFFFISGTACHYSRNNLKRGVLCFLCGMLLTFVTALLFPDEIILFGVLQGLGICMMLFNLFRPLVLKLPPWIGMIVCLLFWLFLFHLPDGYLGFSRLVAVSLPKNLYKTDFLFWLGFPNALFFSSDYFPVFPWLFVFLSGAFFGVKVKSGRLPRGFYPSRPRIPFLACAGRHTLLIYLLHQPILYGTLYLIFSVTK